MTRHEHPIRRGVAAALVLAALTAAGCGSSSQSPSSTPATAQPSDAPTATTEQVASTTGPNAQCLSPGVADDTKPIPELRIGDTHNPATVDPPSTFNQETASPMLEGLVILCPDGSVKPWLAESMSQPKPNVYVFKLRHGVQFWDGNEMTADDVVTSLEHAADPKQPSSSGYHGVQSVEATDPYTVTITLKSPDAGFLQTLAWEGGIIEKKDFEAHKATYGQPGTLIQATGPWEITKLTPNTSAEFVANPHYWGGKVPIDKITINYFADETSEALAFRSGAIDVAFPFQGTAFASAAGTKLQSVPATSLGLLGMNVKLPPWNDVHVRRAVAYALDRDALVKALGSPAVPVSTVILPEQLQTIASKEQVDELLKSLPSYPYDLDKAKAELAQSKYPDGFSGTTDTAKGGVASVPVSEAIAGMLSKIGIDLKVRILGGDAWINELVGPKKFGAVFTTFNIGSPDPSGYPAWFLGSKNTPAGGWNWANYDPPEMDKLLEESVSTTDKAARLATYKKILTMVAEDVPYVPILEQQYNMALSPKLTWTNFNQNFGRTPWELQLQAAS